MPDRGITRPHTNLTQPRRVTTFDALQLQIGVLMARALWGLLILFAVPVFGADRSLNQRTDHELGNLVQIYEGIHAAPELSHHEEQTSALLAKELRAAGYTVTDHLGKYADPGL